MYRPHTLAFVRWTRAIPGRPFIAGATTAQLYEFLFGNGEVGYIFSPTEHYRAWLVCVADAFMARLSLAETGTTSQFSGFSSSEGIAAPAPSIRNGGFGSVQHQPEFGSQPGTQSSSNFQGGFGTSAASFGNPSPSHSPNYRRFGRPPQKYRRPAPFSLPPNQRGLTKPVKQKYSPVPKIEPNPGLRITWTSEITEKSDVTTASRDDLILFLKMNGNTSFMFTMSDKELTSLAFGIIDQEARGAYDVPQPRKQFVERPSRVDVFWRNSYYRANGIKVRGHWVRRR